MLPYTFRYRSRLKNSRYDCLDIVQYETDDACADGPQYRIVQIIRQRPSTHRSSSYSGTDCYSTPANAQNLAAGGQNLPWSQDKIIRF